MQYTIGAESRSVARYRALSDAKGALAALNHMAAASSDAVPGDASG